MLRVPQVPTWPLEGPRFISMISPLLKTLWLLRDYFQILRLTLCPIPDHGRVYFLRSLPGAKSNILTSSQLNKERLIAIHQKDTCYDRNTYASAKIGSQFMAGLANSPSPANLALFWLHTDEQWHFRTQSCFQGGDSERLALRQGDHLKAAVLNRLKQPPQTLPLDPPPQCPPSFSS